MPVFLCQQHRRCKLPGTVNIPPPPPSERFSQARRLFCFLHRRLRHHGRVLGIIFLCRRLRRCCQFLRPVIATLQPPSLSPFPCQLRHCLQSLGRIVYSSSSANSSVVVVDYACQSLKDYLPLVCCLRILSGDNLHL